MATTVELKISLKCFLSIDQRYTKQCLKLLGLIIINLKKFDSFVCILFPLFFLIYLILEDIKH